MSILFWLPEGLNHVALVTFNHLQYFEIESLLLHLDRCPCSLFFYIVYFQWNRELSTKRVSSGQVILVCAAIMEGFSGQGFFFFFFFFSNNPGVHPIQFYDC